MKINAESVLRQAQRVSVPRVPKTIVKYKKPQESKLPRNIPEVEETIGKLLKNAQDGRAAMETLRQKMVEVSTKVKKLLHKRLGVLPETLQEMAAAQARIEERIQGAFEKAELVPEEVGEFYYKFEDMLIRWTRYLEGFDSVDDIPQPEVHARLAQKLSETNEALYDELVEEVYSELQEELNETTQEVVDVVEILVSTTGEKEISRVKELVEKELESRTGGLRYDAQLKSLFSKVTQWLTSLTTRIAKSVERGLKKLFKYEKKLDAANTELEKLLKAK